MATINAQVISQGFLPMTQSTIYTVPDGQAAYIKFWHCSNSGSATQTAELFVASGSDYVRSIGRMQLLEGEYARVIAEGETLTLGAGTRIEAVTTNTNYLEYIITGVMETL